MKKLIIAAAILAASVTAAEAKCSKKALNGSWSLAVNGEVAAIGTASGGIFSFAGGLLSLTLSNFSSTTCKGSGTGQEGGAPFTFKMASESIPGSSQKPNQLMVNIDIGGGDFLPAVLQRQ